MIARTALLVLLLSATATFGAQRQFVQMTDKKDRIEITYQGKPFAVLKLNKNGKLPKPYMYPVRYPGGPVLTRPIAVKGNDHPHHKGIWVAVDEVNGVRFWAEKGKIITKSANIVRSKLQPPQIHIVNEWKAPSGKTEVTEDTLITVFPGPTLDYRITFKAGSKPVEFHDTKEGLFGFRMVNSMRTRQGGKIVNAKGQKGEKDCWGKPAAWVDYYGEVAGKTYGLAIFDDSKNFRPSRYHVRAYGLFSISPFGEKSYSRGKSPAKPVVIKPGKSLTLHYAMYIHAGDTNAAKVGSVYKKWVSETSE